MNFYCRDYFLFMMVFFNFVKKVFLKVKVNSLFVLGMKIRRKFCLVIENKLVEMENKFIDIENKFEEGKDEIVFFIVRVIVVF